MSRPKRGLSLVLLLVGSLLLSACRKEPEGVTVRFWAMGREAEVVTGLIKEFEAENPASTSMCRTFRGRPRTKSC